MVFLIWGMLQYKWESKKANGSETWPSVCRYWRVAVNCQRHAVGGRVFFQAPKFPAVIHKSHWLTSE